MKVLTPEQMREVDRRTIELGIPGLVLMENAGHRVAEFLAARFAPLDKQRIVILCGKGNNGGDGFVIARQLLTRLHPASLDVLLAAKPEDLRGDAAANYRMWTVCGGTVVNEINPRMRAATLVIDALLGTGLKGPVTGRFAELAEEINTGFPLATIVSVDVPSGPVRAHHTVTFVAPKIDQVLDYEPSGELIVGNIGTPTHLLDDVKLHLSEPADFKKLLAPRVRNSNKGIYGHVLVIGGSAGKTGAVQLTGLAALRAGAGLVTVASDAPSLPPELMMAPLSDIDAALEKKTIVAIGPGLGTEPAAIELVRKLFREVELPMVVDADALNCLAASEFKGGAHLRVLTPHPGEMGRLAGISTKAVQQDRLGVASAFATERNVILVLKGDRTIIALPDGRAWINPTGSPALATGGTGDVLTGLTAGLLAQSQNDVAVRAAVWLHGRAGELGAVELGEQSFLAGDIFTYLPGAMNECR